MSRLPYAAKQLITQVTSFHPKAKATPVGLPDGLGVYRAIKFDKRTSKVLHPVMDHLDDRRIVGSHMEDGYLTVTFVATRHADIKTPYPLAEAQVVADAESVEKRVDDTSDGEPGVDGSGVEPSSGP